MDGSNFEAAIEKLRLPNCAATVVDRDGLCYALATGQANVETGAAMRCDTIIQIASLTKALVSTAALMLVGQGRLDLHADLGELVPELANPQVKTGVSPEGYVITRPAIRPITLHRLLTHTSGYSYDHIKPKAQPLARPAASTIRPELAGICHPLAFDPGDRWEYGVSIDWVGQVIESVSGVTLGTWLREALLDPLGMADTGFRPVLPDDAARLHVRSADGEFRVTEVNFGGGAIQSGGGGLTSTVLDYSRFIRMMLGGGEFDGRQIVSPATVELLSSNQTGRLKVGIIESPMSEFPQRIDLFPGIDCEWTYGFLRSPVAQSSGMRAGTLSWLGATGCHYWIDQSANLGGVFASQLLPLGDDQVLAGYESLVHAAYAGA